jgi:hypothetical protein
MIKFQQERLWRAQYDGKDKELRKLEDNFIREFYKAKFLIPVQTIHSAEAENGMVNKGSSFAIPTLSKPGTNFEATAFFSDWNEFEMLYNKQNWGGWIWAPEDLMSAPNDTLVLNPMTLDFTMPKTMLGQLLQIAKTELS